MKFLLLLTTTLLLSSCAYKVVVQDCSPTESGEDWVCKKSIWGR